jgi:hypothetical protein
VTHWLSGKGFQSESSARVRDSNSISPRGLGIGRFGFGVMSSGFHCGLWAGYEG